MNKHVVLVISGVLGMGIVILTCMNSINPVHVRQEGLSKVDAFTSPTSFDLSQGLIAHYPFNGNANDESENGHNGIVNGATLEQGKCGNENEAFSFDGLDDNVELGHSISLGTSNFTLCALVKPYSINSSSIYSILTKGLTNSGNPPEVGYSLLIMNGGLCFFVDGGEPKVGISGALIPVGEWSFITAVRNGTSLLLYMNGELVATSSDPLVRNINSDIPLNFGSAAFNTEPFRSNFFNGAIDDIRIYSRALLPEEVLELSESYSCDCAAETGNAQRLAQSDSLWGTDEYGIGCRINNGVAACATSGRLATIGSHGCFLTCITMFLNTLDIGINPHDANEILKFKSGFDNCCNAGPLIYKTRLIEGFVTGANRTKFNGANLCATEQSADEELTRFICELKQPVLVGVKPRFYNFNITSTSINCEISSWGHWVIAVKKENGRFKIWDPAGRNHPKQYLDEYTPANSLWPWYYVCGSIYDPIENLSSMEISSPTFTQFEVKDPNGILTGFNEETGTVNYNIDKSYYFTFRYDDLDNSDFGKTEETYFGRCQPISGVYEVTLYSSENTGIAYAKLYCSGLSGKPEQPITLPFITCPGSNTKLEIIAEFGSNVDFKINRKATIKSSINELIFGYQIGYFKNNGIFNSIKRKLSNADYHFENGNLTATGNILKATLNELSAQKGKNIDREFCEIIVDNILYIVNNLAPSQK